MNNFKIQLNKLLYRAGIRDMLSSQVVNAVEIKENQEKLFDIKKHHGFFYGEKLQSEPHVFLRETVYKKLCEAQLYLPENYYFKIYSAYRSLKEQHTLWDNRYNQIKAQNPEYSETELIRETKRFCANPNTGFGGHQTGGAVDVGLCNNEGVDYPMGTLPSEVNSKTKAKAHNLTPQERKNRAILFRAMKKAGFANYPQEWWHFSYGDRLWAAYKNKKKCFYGLAKESNEK